jgi:hypothetical protein
MVLLNAPTVSVHKSEILLRRGRALVRGEAIPFQSLCVVLGDTAGVSVHKSEIKLGTWVTPLGKLTKKLNCSCIIAPAKSAIPSSNGPAAMGTMQFNDRILARRIHFRPGMSVAFSV